MDRRTLLLLVVTALVSSAATFVVCDRRGKAELKAEGNSLDLSLQRIAIHQPDPAKPGQTTYHLLRVTDEPEPNGWSLTFLPDKVGERGKVRCYAAPE